MSGKKGSFGSKQVVKCGYCDETSRKDNLVRHIETKHPGESFKFSYIECPHGIKNFLIPAPKVSENNPGEDKTVSNEENSNEKEIEPPDEVDIERVEEHSVTEADINLKRKSDNSDDQLGPKTKKQMLFWNGNDIDEKFENLHTALIEKFENLELKVDNFSDQLVKAKLSSVQTSSIRKSDGTEKEKDVYEGLISFVTNSKDIESLEKALNSLKIYRIDASPLECFYYCSTCLDGNTPSEKSRNTPGCFTFNKVDYDLKIEESPNKQPRSFINLKMHVLTHLQNNNYHNKKMSEEQKNNEKMRVVQSRSKKVGLNLFRLRYTGIKQAKSRTSFVDDVLTAKLNGTDVGNINHSTVFVKDLDKSIYETMKDDLKVAIETVLPATKQKRPLGMVMDKMTPSKRTGQIHAIILPVPENSLSQHLLVPLMLDVPIVKDDQYDAEGLSKMAKKILNDAGAEDEQLEGIGWDGEYIKKGVKAKFMSILGIKNWSNEQKDRWITSVWEPAHELELATKDLRKESIFEWFNKDVDLINEAVGMLNIGKGLQQSIETAERLGLKHYKLKNMSDTRFVAYWGGCLSSFEKDLQISIEVLKVKSETASKAETREKAARVLKRIQTQQFMLLNLGLIDIYQELGETSKMLQKVEQFPWDIPKIQQNLVRNLRRRAEIKLADQSGNRAQEELDEKLWPALKKNIDSVISCEYKGLQTTIFNMFRRGRSGDDMNAGTLSLRITIQNKLSSFCKTLAAKFDGRIQDNITHSSTQLIKTMANCLDLNEMIEKGIDDDEFNTRGPKNLEELLSVAQYEKVDIDQIVSEYHSFKSSLKILNNSRGDENHYIRLFEFLLFKRHECQEYICGDNCPLKDQLEHPRKPNSMKFLHIFLREKELYEGHQNFLNFLLRCTVKTHAEGVAESMGSVIDIHSDKQRGGLSIEDVGKESIIHWNGPPVHLCDSLGEKSLNRHFKGRPVAFCNETW